MFRIKTTSEITQEKYRTTLLFLVLFYILSLSNDLIFYYIVPKYFSVGQIGVPEEGLGYIVYLVEIALLPIAIYLIKNKQIQKVKYLYFITYIILSTINDFFIYYKNETLPYQGGSIFEIALILFIPIFVSRKYYYLVTLCTMLKYLILGIVLNTPVVILPITLIFILSIVSLILLNLFISYTDAIKGSLENQMNAIVKGVVATLELKDPYTRGHSERVAAYSQILAKKIGTFTKEELTSFNYACLLHDIGKINIPDQILMKPSKLTDEEYTIIKTHPTVGSEALCGIEGLESSLDVVKYHHERWDGKGYPENLSGEEIPILARIVAVADAFDAMTSSRSYRSALALDVAYKRIIENMGTQFDPNLLSLFKEVFSEWINYYREHHLPTEGVYSNKSSSKIG
jgi:HD-GYP domain-containing protein (c-di-GMP phosphodiesterase class II)